MKMIYCDIVLETYTYIQIADNQQSVKMQTISVQLVLDTCAIT